jgi:hypothetical protein
VAEQHETNIEQEEGSFKRADTLCPSDHKIIKVVIVLLLAMITFMIICGRYLVWYSCTEYQACAELLTLRYLTRHGMRYITILYS